MKNTIDYLLSSPAFQLAQKVQVLKQSQAVDRLLGTSTKFANPASEMVASFRRWEDYFKPNKLVVDMLSKQEMASRHVRLSLESAIPPSTLLAINNIARIQRQFFYTESITAGIKQAQYIQAQAMSLRFSALTVSKNIIDMLIADKQFDALEAFEDMAAETLELNEQTANATAITVEDLNRLRDEMLAKIDTIGKDSTSRLMHAITILSMIYSIFCEYRYQTTKGITPEDFSRFKIEMKEELLKKAQDDRLVRFTRARVKVFVKPKINSYVITPIDSNTEVVVLAVNHKWVYVSFENEDNGLLQTGWILKKYINAK